MLVKWRTDGFDWRENNDAAVQQLSNENLTKSSILNTVPDEKDLGNKTYSNVSVIFGRICWTDEYDHSQYLSFKKYCTLSILGKSHGYAD